MTKVLYKKSNETRTAIITEGTYFCKGQFVVRFYYKGYPDFEWKRGAHGMSCDLCDMFEQAKRKANYYVSKNW